MVVETKTNACNLQLGCHPLPDVPNCVIIPFCLPAYILLCWADCSRMLISAQILPEFQERLDHQVLEQQ